MVRDLQWNQFYQNMDRLEEGYELSDKLDTLNAKLEVMEVLLKMAFALPVRN